MLPANIRNPKLSMRIAYVMLVSDFPIWGQKKKHLAQISPNLNGQLKTILNLESRTIEISENLPIEVHKSFLDLYQFFWDLLICTCSTFLRIISKHKILSISVLTLSIFASEGLSTSLTYSICFMFVSLCTVLM